MNNRPIRATFNHERLVKHRKHRAIILGILASVIMLFILINIHATYAQLNDTKQQIKVSQQKLGRVNQTNKQLKLNVRQLNNRDYLDQLIRDKYYFTKSGTGEKVYILPSDSAKDVTQK